MLQEKELLVCLRPNNFIKTMARVHNDFAIYKTHTIDTLLPTSNYTVSYIPSHSAIHNSFTTYNQAKKYLFLMLEKTSGIEIATLEKSIGNYWYYKLTEEFVEIHKSILSEMGIEL